MEGGLSRKGVFLPESSSGLVQTILCLLPDYVAVYDGAMEINSLME